MADDKKYDKLKEYKGKRYSGMKIGGTHKWYYDKGEWRERKKHRELTTKRLLNNLEQTDFYLN